MFLSSSTTFRFCLRSSLFSTFAHIPFINKQWHHSACSLITSIFFSVFGAALSLAKSLMLLLFLPVLLPHFSLLSTILLFISAFFFIYQIFLFSYIEKKLEIIGDSGPTDIENTSYIPYPNCCTH